MRETRLGRDVALKILPAAYDARTESLGEPQPVSPVRQTGHPFFGSTWSPDSRRIAGWTASDINDPDGRRFHL